MEVAAETAVVSERLRAAEAAVYRHELINAFAAIEGAAMILEQENFGAERDKLHQMLASEIGRLRDLLDPRRAGFDRVWLADTAAELAHEPAWRHQLHVDVPADLVAAGSPGQTKEAVRQVLGHVSRRASAAPLTVRGRRDGEWVGLWVDDSVPDPSRRQRRALFAVTGDRPLRSGFPMPLHLAARLLRAQDGALRVEARPGGVVSFGACLPAAPEDGRGEAGGHHT
jgi:hypothetical protein